MLPCSKAFLRLTDDSYKTTVFCITIHSLKCILESGFWKSSVVEYKRGIASCGDIIQSVAVGPADAQPPLTDPSPLFRRIINLISASARCKLLHKEEWRLVVVVAVAPHGRRVSATPNGRWPPHPPIAESGRGRYPVTVQSPQTTTSASGGRRCNWQPLRCGTRERAGRAAQWPKSLSLKYDRAISA